MNEHSRATESRKILHLAKQQGVCCRDEGHNTNGGPGLTGAGDTVPGYDIIPGLGICC